jgi:hypothetical protein
VYVLPVERGDWFQVARAILTLRFWRGTLTTDPGYTWWVASQQLRTSLRSRRNAGHVSQGCHVGPGGTGTCLCMAVCACISTVVEGLEGAVCKQQGCNTWYGGIHAMWRQ